MEHCFCGHHQRSNVILSRVIIQQNHRPVKNLTNREQLLLR